MKKIYIIGAGGLGREAVWLVERINSRKKEPEWEIQGFWMMIRQSTDA